MRCLNKERKQKANGRKITSSFPDSEESWTKALNSYTKEIEMKARKDKDEIEDYLDKTSYLDFNMLYG